MTAFGEPLSANKRGRSVGESPLPAARAEASLIDLLLLDQQTLTAVDQFSRMHPPHAAPAQQKYYRDLIPLGAPGPGEQYAFVVDLDRCSGCKACVSACHSLNGLDEDEMWRNVGLLVGQQNLPSAQPEVRRYAT